MKTRTGWLVVVVGLGLAGVLGVIGLLPGAPTHAAPTTDGYSIYYVAPGGNCGGMTPCFSTIQAAVDAVDADGETVKVAQGVYTDMHAVPVPSDYQYPPPSGIITQMVYVSKTLTLQGGYQVNDWNNPNPALYTTTLDAQGRGRVILIWGLASPTVSGLWLINGQANGLGGGLYEGYGSGGGICVGSSQPVTINNNVILGNLAPGDVGGGIACGRDLTSSGCTLIITSNIIEKNIGMYGGGIGTTGEVFLTSNMIVSNTASGFYGIGGGLYVNGAALLSSNQISGNIATWQGGGIWSSGAITMMGNLVLGNSMPNGPGGYGGGGGVYLALSDAQLSNNVFANNWTGGSGSAIFARGRIRSIHDTFSSNSGNAAISFPQVQVLYDGLWLTNTIVAGQAIGLSGADIGDEVTINGILWHNTPITVSATSSATVIISDQYYGDPAFAADGYHLTAGSAALNRGVPTNVTTDIDGEPRPSGLAPDLGADEFQEPPVLPGIPVQISPPNGAVTTTVNITFHWQAGGGGAPQGYNLDLDGAVITTTATSYAANLSAGAHTWRVRAFNAAGYSDWTGEWTIRVNAYRVYLPIVIK